MKHDRIKIIQRNDLHLTLYHYFYVIASIQEVTQVEDFGIYHIDALVLDNHQYLNRMKSLVLNHVMVLKIQMKWNTSRSRYTDFYKQRRDSSSPQNPSFRNNCYCFYSRSNSRKWQYFGDYNSSDWHPSRPVSKSASASWRFDNNLRPNFSENKDKHSKKNFSKSTDNIEIYMYISGLENAVSTKVWFCNLYIRSQNENDSCFFSRIEIGFIVAGGSLISVLDSHTILYVEISNVQCLYSKSTICIKNAVIAN